MALKGITIQPFRGGEPHGYLAKEATRSENDSLTRIVSFASGNSIDWKFVSGQVSEDGSCSADFEADAPKPKSKFRLHGEVSQYGESYHFSAI